jgi:hypothetical protein
MIQPTVYYINQCYFVKDNVIFEIHSGSSSSDPCAKCADSIKANLPSFTVKDSTGKENTMYLDIYIKDGDKYVSNKFKKTIHSSTGETEMEFQAYFKKLCEDEIYNDVLSHFDKNFTWFSKHLNALGVPLYMIAGKGYTVTGVEQITFNSSYLTTLKNKIVKDEVKKAADSKSDEFGYKLTDDSKIEVEKK